MKICSNCGFRWIPLNRKEKLFLFLARQQAYRYKPLNDALEKSKDWCIICKKDCLLPLMDELLRKSEWGGRRSGLIVDW